MGYQLVAWLAGPNRNHSHAAIRTRIVWKNGSKSLSRNSAWRRSKTKRGKTCAATGYQTMCGQNFKYSGRCLAIRFVVGLTGLRHVGSGAGSWLGQRGGWPERRQARSRAQRVRAQSPFRPHMCVRSCFGQMARQGVCVRVGHATACRCQRWWHPKPVGATSMRPLRRDPHTMTRCGVGFLHSLSKFVTASIFLQEQLNYKLAGSRVSMGVACSIPSRIIPCWHSLK